MQEPNSTPQSPEIVDNERLYRHTAKPKWGLAVLAWERDGKRGYQFEDGKLRIFKRGYFNLLEPVDRPADETEAALRELNIKLGRRDAARRNGRERPAIPLAKQIELFTALFPDGFQDEAWIAKKRGTDAKRALKRHRDPVIRQARELFTRQRLETLVAEGNALEVIASFGILIDSTDLVSKAQARGLNRINEPLAARVVEALVRVLWGEGDLAPRFEAFAGALGRAIGKKPSWQLATAIPALVAPSEHLCVKPNVLKAQAEWMAPKLIIEKAPSGAVYTRILSMASVLIEKLAQAGYTPRDLVDVYDFVWETLRPKAQTMIQAGDLPQAN